MNFKILLTGAYNYSEDQIEKIRELGFDVDFIQFETDEINDVSYDCVVCNGLFLHHDIKKFKRLKFIQLTSAGYDRVPVEYIKEQNIKIYNAAGVYSIPIAEYAVLKILEFYKKSRDFYKKQELSQWDKERNILELYEKKVAIIGYGNIGKEIAKRLKGFGTKITAVDVVDVADENVDYFEYIEKLKYVLSESDIIILTLPLNQNTKHIIDESCIENMNKNTLLINVSRGQIIKQEVFINALKINKIAGAVLDVFEDEPLPKESELWNMKNVIITPHNSFVGEGNAMRMFDVIYKNLEEWKIRYENNGYFS